MVDLYGINVGKYTIWTIYIYDIYIYIYIYIYMGPIEKNHASGKWMKRRTLVKETRLEGTDSPLNHDCGRNSSNLNS